MLYIYVNYPKLYLALLNSKRSLLFQGRVPLHWAAGNGHPDAVSALLRAGAKANVADKDGWTPLHRYLSLFNLFLKYVISDPS